ncbi:unnamed protein product, partial [Effrenium voratum]
TLMDYHLQWQDLTAVQIADVLVALQLAKSDDKSNGSSRLGAIKAARWFAKLARVQESDAPAGRDKDAVSIASSDSSSSSSSSESDDALSPAKAVSDLPVVSSPEEFNDIWAELLPLHSLLATATEAAAAAAQAAVQVAPMDVDRVFNKGDGKGKGKGKDHKGGKGGKSKDKQNKGHVAKNCWATPNQQAQRHTYGQSYSGVRSVEFDETPYEPRGMAMQDHSDQEQCSHFLLAQRMMTQGNRMCQWRLKMLKTLRTLSVFLPWYRNLRYPMRPQWRDTV